MVVGGELDCVELEVELDVDVDVLVLVSSTSDSVVRVTVPELRLGVNELFGAVRDVLVRDGVRDGTVVSVGTLDSGATLIVGSLVGAVVTGVGSLVTVDAEGLIPAMPNVTAEVLDVDACSPGVLAGSIR